MTFENGHYRPTTKAEFAAARDYLERVEAADSRRLQSPVKTPSPPAPLPREARGRGETGSGLGGGHE